jgi:glycosyltransferase involved in cell wall biosynthesis
MKVLIVSPFFEDNPSISRPSFVNHILKQAGIETKVLSSDFSHASKRKREIKGVILFSTIEYKNNKSILRFISHIVLSIKFSIYVLLKCKHFDKIYITIPFGLTALIVSLLCKKKLIVDIVDYWPSSLPFSNNIKSLLHPLFSIWEKINFLAVKRAAQTISLSSSFLAKSKATGFGTHILLGATDKSHLVKAKPLSVLRILYVGNIGRLYDFDTLISAIVESDLKVKFEIVGDGDNAKKLKKRLLKNRIDFAFHGIIYDEKHLAKIVNNIDFGFNGFVSTTASLSYKSVMYMSFGLPIINSMKGDLWNFVEDNDLGFNYVAGDVASLKDCLQKAFSMKNQSLNFTVTDFFRENFEMEVVTKQVLEVFNNETNF